MTGLLSIFCVTLAVVCVSVGIGYFSAVIKPIMSRGNNMLGWLNHLLK